MLSTQIPREVIFEGKFLGYFFDPSGCKANTGVLFAKKMEVEFW
jgi:hypothetical protein